MANNRLSGFWRRSKGQTGRIALLGAIFLVTVWFAPLAWALEGLEPEKKTVFRQERGSIWVGLGPLTGDVTYRIGGYAQGQAGGRSFELSGPFPWSKLQFPLNTLMFTVGGELRFFQKAEFRIAFSKNLDSKPGKFNDSDWETDRVQPFAKTLYSESDTLFKGYIIDLGLRYWLLEKPLTKDFSFGLAPSASLLYQQFSWDARNLVQDDLVTGDRLEIAGPDLYYKFTLVMPFMDIAGKLTFKRLSLLVGFGYSPRVIAYDKDYHLLRYRLTTTKAYGEGFRFGLQSRFALSRHWFLMFSAEGLQFKAEGMDQNKFYSSKYPDILPKNDSTWSTKHLIKGYQASLKGGIGFQF